MTWRTWFRVICRPGLGVPPGLLPAFLWKCLIVWTFSAAIEFYLICRWIAASGTCAK